MGRRVAPFIVAALAGYAVSPFVGAAGWKVLIGGALIPIAVGLVFVTPWSRLPAWAQAIPPLLGLAGLGLLRVLTGGVESEFTPLLILPLVWFAVYGTRAELAVCVCVEGAAIALPAAIIGPPDHPHSEYALALAMVCVSGVLGFIVQQLVVRIRSAETEQRGIIESAHESFIAIDAKGTIVEWNSQAESDFGWSRAEAIGRSLAETIVPPESREAHEAGLRRFAETGEGKLIGKRVELQAQRRDGSTFPVELSISPVRSKHGLRFNAFLHDISDRLAAQAELQAAEEQFRRAFEDAGIGMSLCDLGGRFIRANRALADITGYSIDELVGMRFGELTHPADRGRQVDAFDRLISGESDRYQGENRYYHKRGHIVWIALNVSAVRGPGGEVHHLICQIQDISERKLAEARLAYQASHDPLTDLPNRVLLDDRMAMALRRLSRARLPLAVLFLDLDRFKLVNDTFGHDAGDQLLLEAAERLRSVIRPSDTVVRMGGDEFAILCEEVTPDAAATLARRIGEAIAVPFRVEGREVVVTSSIGIAMNRDPSVSPGTLLANADAAMYEAKARGRSRYAFFEDEMRTRASARLDFERELRGAVGADRLTVHYQPQFDLSSGRVVGAEALARWEHPQRGLLPASEFMPVAEESDLVVAVGTLAIEEAARRAAQWRAHSPDILVTVNVSGRELGGHELPGIVVDALDRSGAPADALCIEMTEAAVIEDPESAFEAMHDLKDLGVALSIDEFGVGSSTFGLIRRMPALDLLKIDRIFTSGLGDTGRSGERDLVEAMIGMARALRMRTLAEGVENDGQVEALRELGCDAAQGFHLAHPGPPDDIERLLTEPARA